MKKQNNSTETYPIHVGADFISAQKHRGIKKQTRNNPNSISNNYHHSINLSWRSVKSNLRRAWHIKTSGTGSRTIQNK